MTGVFAKPLTNIVPLPELPRTTIDLSTVFYSQMTMKHVTTAVLANAPDLPDAAKRRIKQTNFEGLIPLDIAGAALSKRIRAYLFKEFEYKGTDELARRLVKRPPLPRTSPSTLTLLATSIGKPATLAIRDRVSSARATLPPHSTKVCRGCTLRLCASTATTRGAGGSG